VRKYSTKLPLELEHLGQFDKYDFSSETKLSFNSKISYDNIKCSIDCNEKVFIAKIDNIIAENESEAFNKICTFLDYLTKILSYLIQKENNNPHYGHIRINYKKKKIKIKPRDQVINDELSMKTTLHPDISGMQKYLEKVIDSSELHLLITAYYNSLSVADLKTKFYHAFTIIEYIENKYSEKIETTQLLSDDLYQNIETDILAHLNNNDQSEKIINRIKGTLRSTIKKRTYENRKEKLLEILNDFLGIKSVRYLTKEQDINEKFVSDIIKYRNKFFHKPMILSENDRKKFKFTTDILIILCEEIISRELIEK